MVKPSEWKRPLGCIPFTGPEKSIPLGYYSNIPNLGPEDLVSYWEIVDKTAPDGIRDVHITDNMPDDAIIIGAQINQALVTAIKQSYGDDFMQFADATTGDIMARDEWIRNNKRDNHDPLELAAIATMRRCLRMRRHL